MWAARVLTDVNIAFHRPAQKCSGGRSVSLALCNGYLNVGSRGSGGRQHRLRPSAQTGPSRGQCELGAFALAISMWAVPVDCRSTALPFTIRPKDVRRGMLSKPAAVALHSSHLVSWQRSACMQRYHQWSCGSEWRPLRS